jgi:hypothetical protein
LGAFLATVGLALAAALTVSLAFALFGFLAGGLGRGVTGGASSNRFYSG